MRRRGSAARSGRTVSYSTAIVDYTRTSGCPIDRGICRDDHRHVRDRLHPMRIVAGFPVAAAYDAGLNRRPGIGGSMKSILDPSFRYTSSLHTDVRKTF